MLLKLVFVFIGCYVKVSLNLKSFDTSRKAVFSVLVSMPEYLTTDSLKKCQEALKHELVSKLNMT